MDYEEIEEFFNSLERETAAEIKRQNDFIKELETTVAEIAFSSFPEIEIVGEKYKREFKQEIHELAIILNEKIEYYRILKPEVTEAAGTITEEPQEKEEEEGCFERERMRFVAKCHYRIKEIVTKHFPEIAELEGEQIRQINFSAYIHATLISEGIRYLRSLEI